MSFVLMRKLLISITICLTLASTGNGEEHTDDWLPVPQDLRGRWFVSKCEHGGKPHETTLFANGVMVDKQYFWPSDMSREDAEAANRLFDVRCSPNDPTRVVLFWFCGVYRRVGNDLELLLSYRGQGLEGDAAKNWRWPKVADIGKPTRLSVVTLTRKRSEIRNTTASDGG